MQAPRSCPSGGKRNSILWNRNEPRHGKASAHMFGDGHRKQHRSKCHFAWETGCQSSMASHADRSSSSISRSRTRMFSIAKMCRSLFNGSVLVPVFQGEKDDVVTEPLLAHVPGRSLEIPRRGLLRPTDHRSRTDLPRHFDESCERDVLTSSLRASHLISLIHPAVAPVGRDIPVYGGNGRLGVPRVCFASVVFGV